MGHQLIIEVPSGFRGIPRRASKVRWVWAVAEVPIQIVDVAGFDDPSAVVMSYERRARSGRRGEKEIVRRETAGHAGVLWRPVPGPHGGRAQIADLVGNQRDMHWPEFPLVNWRRYREAAAWPAYAAALAGMREIREDASENAMRYAARAAEGVIAAPDGLWRRDIEPVWMVIETADHVEVDWCKPYPDRLRAGIPFRLDRRDDAEAVGLSIAEWTGKPFRTSGMRADKADPAFLRCDTVSALMGMLQTRARSEHRVLARLARQDGFDVRASSLELLDRATTEMQAGHLVEAAATLDAMSAAIRGGSSWEPPDPYARGEAPAYGGWETAVRNAIRAGVLDSSAAPESRMTEEDDDAMFALAGI